MKAKSKRVAEENQRVAEVASWLFSQHNYHLENLLEEIDGAAQQAFENWLEEAQGYHDERGGIPHKLTEDEQAKLFELVMRNGQRPIDEMEASLASGKRRTAALREAIYAAWEVSWRNAKLNGKAADRKRRVAKASTVQGEGRTS